MTEPSFLLTGANGFLGSMLLLQLEKHAPVVTLGRGAANQIQVDLGGEVPDFKTGFQTVVHNAGKAHVVPRGKKEEQAFFQVNHRGTLNLLKGLANAPSLPHQLIFISTVAVYGAEQGENIDETYPLNGATPYAHSKILAENAIQTWCERHQVGYLILRLPLVVGIRPPGNLGAMIRAIKRGYYLKIKGNNARKSAVLGSDVAKLVVSSPQKQGIFNLTDGIHPPFSAIEQALEKAGGKAIKIAISSGMAARFAQIGNVLAAYSLPVPLTTSKLDKLTASLTFSDEKARQEINWQPNPVLPFLEHLHF